MIRTVRALVDAQGNVQWLEPLEVAATCMALVTLLDDKGPEAALLSEKALDDWLRPEEREAWAYLAEEEPEIRL